MLLACGASAVQMRPPPVYPPEPQREGGLYNREEVEGVLIDRAYQQLVRHPSYGRVWNMQPVVRGRAPGRWHQRNMRAADVFSLVQASWTSARQHGAVESRICREVATRVQQTTLASAGRMGTGRGR